MPLHFTGQELAARREKVVAELQRRGLNPSGGIFPIRRKLRAPATRSIAGPRPMPYNPRHPPADLQEPRPPEVEQ